MRTTITAMLYPKHQLPKKLTFTILLFFLLGIPFSASAQSDFSEQIIITDTHAEGVIDVFTIDLDRDGTLEVLSANNDDGTSYFFRNLGEADFLSALRITTNSNIRELIAGVTRNNGEIDVLTTGNSMLLNLNKGDEDFLAFGFSDIVDARSLNFVDLDNDGDNDILFRGYRESTESTILGWFKNNGEANFGDPIAIYEYSDSESTPTEVTFGDLDGDGDEDVVTGTFSTGDIYWFENTGGDFESPILINGSQSDLRVLRTNDFDKDGNEDILAGRSTGLYHIKSNGDGTFADAFYRGASNIGDIEFADINEDGYSDVIYSNSINGQVFWKSTYEGRFNFEESLVGSLAGVNTISVGDLDEDGHIDVVAGSDTENKIVWFKHEYFVIKNEFPVTNQDRYNAYPNSVLKVKAPGVLGNDFDPETIELTALVVSQPEHGTVTLNSDGSFEFTPNPGFKDEFTSFTYAASDGEDKTEEMVTILVLNTSPNTLDGKVTDSLYTTLGRSPVEDNSIGYNGAVAGLRGFADSENLYLGIEGYINAGNGDDKYEDMIVFINSSSAIGLPSGEPLPQGTEVESPFYVINGMKLDMEVDYAFRFTGGNDSEIYASIIDYTNGSSVDTFDALISPLDGTLINGSHTGAKYAYQSSPSLTSTVGNGLEMILPLNAIGAIAGDEFQFFVIYGDMEGGSVSPSVIPDDGFFTPYSNTEDWTGLIGTQATELLQGVLTSSEPESMLPKKMVLHENYPNPFNPSTQISFDLSQNSRVNLTVYDILGREVATLVNGKNLSNGTYSFTFDASGLSSGVYIYRLNSNGEMQTRKMTLLK